MKKQPSFASTLYFSYGQFQVHDHGVQLPGLSWTKDHYNQGFIRRESNVALATMLQYGHANIAIFIGSYEANQKYERVIAIPFFVATGSVHTDGPECENEETLQISQGHYSLVAAQYVQQEEDDCTGNKDCPGEEVIHIFFEPVSAPLQKSEILIADATLHPPSPLIETGDIA
jgi:hypothetical protein